MIMMLKLLALLPGLAAAQCATGWPKTAFADAHDGDQKNVSIDFIANGTQTLTISQDAPVAWTLTVPLDAEDCTAIVDFSKSKKPAHPPGPLKVAVKDPSTTEGRTVLEFTDPGAADKNYPQNVWITLDACVSTRACPKFAATPFQDMHDGDVKIVSVDGDTLTLGQPGVWNYTTTVDLTSCAATIDFSKTAKPAKPPVPLVATFAEMSGPDAVGSVVVTWTDPTGTLNKDPAYPLNVWESVTGRA